MAVPQPPDARPGTFAKRLTLTRLIGWLSLGLALGMHAGGALAAGPDEISAIWLAVVLNGQHVSQASLVLRERDHSLYVSEADLRRWRLRVPVAPRLRYGGEEYVSLAELRALSYRIDQPTQTLIVRAPPGAFHALSLSGSADAFARPTPSPPGGFLNYDLAVTRELGQTAASGVLEGSLFGSWGNGVTHFLERDSGGHSRTIRLDTTWTRDLPDRVASLRLGDAITGTSSLWGGAVRFAGVQWASDLATRPGLVTFPLPSLAGAAALPSTLELYVNGALRLRTGVPMGPFQIQDVPAITGDGQVQLVVRNILGQEQLITQSFYATPALLRRGLQEYSYEMGVVRDDYGLASNHYGQALIEGTDRVGLSDRVTADVHAEMLREQQTIGVGGAWLVGSIGVASAAVAASHSRQGAGHLTVLGFERSGRRISFGASLQLASEDFVDVTALAAEPKPLRMISAYANVALGRWGSVGFIQSHAAYRDGHALDLSGIRDDFQIRRFGFVSIAVNRTRSGGVRDTSVELTFTRPLDERTSGELTVARQGGAMQALAQVQRNLPVGSGMGYRVAAGLGGSQDREGELAWQTGSGAYSIDAQRLSGQTQESASASGGIALLDHELFASRRIDGSFAVVDVGKEAGVRVYDDNQLVGRTDGAGRLLVPDLRAYQDNSLSIEQADLPLDVEISTLQRDAVPYYRSGALVRFRVIRPHGALITLVLQSGRSLPAGALVQIAGGQEQFPTGMQGEVYITGMSVPAILQASWPGGTCTAAVPKSAQMPADDPLPRLGPYVCRGASR